MAKTIIRCDQSIKVENGHIPANHANTRYSTRRLVGIIHPTRSPNVNIDITICVTFEINTSQ